MLKKRILKWLLPKLLKKKCPKKISFTGDKGKRVNCFTIFLGADGKKPTYLVDGFDPGKNKLKVLASDENNKFTVEETINLDDALKYTVRVQHDYWVQVSNYNCLEQYCLEPLTYTNVYDLAFNQITKYDEFRVRLVFFWNRRTQSRFNKRKLITKDSIELISFMLNKQLEAEILVCDSWTDSQTSGVSIDSLMTELYTHRWIKYPGSAKEKLRLTLHLDSLVSSGDLRRDSKHQYIVQGQAIKTLEKYEENNRRHKDAVKLQRVIAILTCIIAFSSLVEADLITLPPIADWPSAIYKSLLGS